MRPARSSVCEGLVCEASQVQCMCRASVRPARFSVCEGLVCVCVCVCVGGGGGGHSRGCMNSLDWTGLLDWTTGLIKKWCLHHFESR